MEDYVLLKYWKASPCNVGDGHQLAATSSLFTMHDCGYFVALLPTGLNGVTQSAEVPSGKYWSRRRLWKAITHCCLWQAFASLCATGPGKALKACTEEIHWEGAPTQGDQCPDHQELPEHFAGEFRKPQHALDRTSGSSMVPSKAAVEALKRG
jgi:hypothetical protein